MNSPDWLQLLSPSASTIAAIVDLDPGETEAIALALELRAKWLLIDELAGRREATHRGLRAIGTVGILRDAHHAGFLNLEDALHRLQATGFHVSQSLIQQILDSI
jgi:predicted nucleic acid-binding protein